MTRERARALSVPDSFSLQREKESLCGIWNRIINVNESLCVREVLLQLCYRGMCA